MHGARRLLSNHSWPGEGEAHKWRPRCRCIQGHRLDVVTFSIYSQSDLLNLVTAWSICSTGSWLPKHKHQGAAFRVQWVSLPRRQHRIAPHRTTRVALGEDRLGRLFRGGRRAPRGRSTREVVQKHKQTCHRQEGSDKCLCRDTLSSRGSRGLSCSASYVPSSCCCIAPSPCQQIVPVEESPTGSRYLTARKKAPLALSRLVILGRDRSKKCVLCL